MGKKIEVLDRRERVIGDDWIFSFNVIDEDLVPPGPANLVGYTPGGWLNIPNTTPFAVNNSMVNTMNLAIGQVALTIPRGVTSNFLPDNHGYSLQVYMIDPNNIQTTYVVVPLRVIQI
jgi:hypothetical protein